MTDTVDNPLRSSPPAEVPLQNAPLIRVLAQVRFPLVASIQNLASIAPFQEAIGADYPVLKPEQIHTMVLGPSGPSAQIEQIWRFTDVDGDWRVSLAPNFVALETRSYVSRADFLGRFGRVVGALSGPLNPPVVERFGLRYINRIQGIHFHEIGDLVHPQMRGIVGTELHELMRFALSEAVFDAPDEAAVLHARWGLVPPGATPDPNAVEPVDEKSWILDLDVYSEEKMRRFDAAELARQAESFALRSYTFFRWAVTDRFLARFGGDDA